VNVSILALLQNCSSKQKLFWTKQQQLCQQPKLEQFSFAVKCHCRRHFNK